MEIVRYQIDGCGWLLDEGVPSHGICGLPAAALWYIPNSSGREINVVCSIHDARLIEVLKDDLVKAVEE